MMNTKFSPVNCAEAADICTKAEYKEAGILEKLKLQLHLFFCKNCRKYNARNRKLSNLLKKAEIKACSEEEKQMYKRRIREHSDPAKKNKKQ